MFRERPYNVYGGEGPMGFSTGPDFFFTVTNIKLGLVGCEHLDNCTKFYQQLLLKSAGLDFFFFFQIKNTFPTKFTNMKYLLYTMFVLRLLY
jgi:hypothetical protein